MANKTDYRKVTVCRNDLCTVGLVTGFNVCSSAKYNVCSHRANL